MNFRSWKKQKQNMVNPTGTGGFYIEGVVP